MTKHGFNASAIFTAIALLGLAACAPVHAQSAAASADWSWKKALANGALVEVRNIDGPIEVGPASGNELEVVAHKTTQGGNLAEISVQVEESPRGVVFCVVRTPAGSPPPSGCKKGGEPRNRGDGETVSVAFVVKAPAGLRLGGRTVNGSIKVQRLGGPADLRTVNGSVQVDAAGPVQARTVNGNITARMGRTDWQGELSLATVNGTLDVDLPASASTEVSASTVNGAIQSDFALTVEGRHGPQKAHGTLGAGGRSLTLKSVNGAIRLRRGG